MTSPCGMRMSAPCTDPPSRGIMFFFTLRTRTACSQNILNSAATSATGPGPVISSAELGCGRYARTTIPSCSPSASVSWPALLSWLPLRGPAPGNLLRVRLPPPPLPPPVGTVLRSARSPRLRSLCPVLSCPAPGGSAPRAFP
eukprot:3456991-Prymnesium_polylepis.1